MIDVEVTIEEVLRETIRRTDSKRKIRKAYYEVLEDHLHAMKERDVIRLLQQIDASGGLVVHDLQIELFIRVTGRNYTLDGARVNFYKALLYRQLEPMLAERLKLRVGPEGEPALPSI